MMTRRSQIKINHKYLVNFILKKVKMLSHEKTEERVTYIYYKMLIPINGAEEPWKDQGTIKMRKDK